MHEFDLAQVDRLLTTTRTVRKRLDLTRPVEPDVIQDCIRIATQAPTGSNSQGWRWLVVTDPARRAALADLYREGARLYGLYTPRDEADAAQPADPRAAQMRRVLDSARYLADRLQDVPVHVIPCLSTRLPEQPTIAGTSGLLGSIYPAIWSLQLALRARGLGSALTTLHLLHEREAAELLGIPDHVTQVALLPVAYFTGEDFKPAVRRPAEEITYWEDWKRPRTA